MKIVRSLENRKSQVLEALAKVIDSGQYAEGPYSQEAEALVAQQVGQRAALVNSCGSALYLMFKYLRENEGAHTVLMQNNTFFATGAAARENGLMVSLVDSRPDCPGMSVDSLRSAHKVQADAKTVCITHVGGWMSKDYEAIAQYCRDHNLILVEDCAHAYGLLSAGSLGWAACWSFYPTKAVPCGEGGAVTSIDGLFVNWVREYRQYGKYRTALGGLRYHKGLNLRISEFDAAVLTVQLRNLKDILASRRSDALALQSIAPCLLAGESNYYKYPVLPEFAQGRQKAGKVYARSDQLLNSLAAYGMSVCVTLKNSHAWADGHECLPIGEDLYMNMTTKDVRRALES